MNASPWTGFQRVAFRFCFAYFGLYCSSVIGELVPTVDLPDISTSGPIRAIVFAIAHGTFGATLPLVYRGSGSGDKTYDWVSCFCFFSIASFVTFVWSVLDRRRRSYAKLYAWFRTFVRFSLAATLFGYGMDKFVPVQMPFPSLSTLVEPYGHFSPMGVLWSSIGASPAYERFAGGAELVAGVLLVFPRTTMLGALVAIADMTQVFTLNMTYDVPVKLFSFHLLLLGIFLAAPDGLRLLRFFIFNRAVDASSDFPLFASARANRIATVVQGLYGTYLLVAVAFASADAWSSYGGGAPKSPLYGIWDVRALSIDGKSRPELVTVPDRYRRVIFDRGHSMELQRMDESIVRYGADVSKSEIALSSPSVPKWKAKLSFRRDGDRSMALDGRLDGHDVSMRLAREDREAFSLVSRGFHWIQEYPFHR